MVLVCFFIGNSPLKISFEIAVSALKQILIKFFLKLLFYDRRFQNLFIIFSKFELENLLSQSNYLKLCLRELWNHRFYYFFEGTIEE